ncbi:hypothetical protein KIN20_014535, partial [Parelaphostrongylus tenuis]
DHDRILRAPTLSPDDASGLEIIRQFTFIHRNPDTDGFWTLRRVVRVLMIKNEDYWIPLINSHLEEVEICMIGDRHVLRWRGSNGSN